MDFDFDTLLRKNGTKHKRAMNKPAHIVSFAAATVKRRESQLKARRGSRLSIFDRIRDLPQTPDKKAKAESKLEHRRKALEKWKEEKEKKKKEEAVHKKKPFLAGASTYVAPIAKPSTTTDTARVTRSQAKTSHSNNTVQKDPPKSGSSFAPKNAKFQPPQLKAALQYKLQTVTKNTRNKKTTFNFTFEPILPNTVAKPTTSRNVSRQFVTESKVDSRRSKPTASTSGCTSVKGVTKPVNKKVTKASTLTEPSMAKRTLRNTTATQTSTSSSGGKLPFTKKFTLTSSSSSEIEPPMNKRALRSAKPTAQTSEPEPSKVKKRIQTPRHKIPEKNKPNRKSLKISKEITPKTISYSSSTTESSGDSGPSFDKVDKRRRSARNTHITVSSDSTPIEDVTIVTNEKICRVILTKSSTDSGVSEISPAAVTNKSPVFKPTSTLRTPKEKFIPKSESNSEEKLRSPKSPIDLTATPSVTPRISAVRNTPGSFCPTPKQAQDLKISPTITLSRGKAKARDETKWKLNEGLLDEDTCPMESVAHFRKQLACEIDRLTALCEQWDHIFHQTTLPDFVQEHILSAVGQARLLMSQKLQQFASLVERCAKPEPGTVLVTPTDLLGFWDMVFMQVENVDIKFKNLEKLRDRNWIEEVSGKTKMAPKMAAKPPPRPNSANKAKPAATSRIRDMIAAARKATKERHLQPFPVVIVPPATPTKRGADEKVFEAGFFSVKSPVRTPVVGTPTLLKAVLSSEAKKAQTASVKRNSTSFAMLRASLMSRNVDCEGIDILPQTPISKINMDATPGRSILKSSTKPPRDRESTNKPIKVLFTDLNDSPDKGNKSSSPKSLEARKTITFDGDVLIEKNAENSDSERNTPENTEKYIGCHNEQNQNGTEVNKSSGDALVDTEKCIESDNEQNQNVNEVNKSHEMLVDTEKYFGSDTFTDNTDENVQPKTSEKEKAQNQTSGTADKKGKAQNRLVRQNAVILDTPKKRQTRKSTFENEIEDQKDEKQVKTPKRTTKNEIEDQIDEKQVKTPRRSTRKSRINSEVKEISIQEKTPRSERKAKSKALDEIHNNVASRVTRSRKSVNLN